MIHALILKYTVIKKNQSDRSDGQAVVVVFQEHTTKMLKSEAESFLRFGSHIDSTVFDATLRVCLQRLCIPFHSYLYSDAGKIAKNIFFDCEAEAVHLNAIIIQNMWRICWAKKKVRELQHAKIANRKNSSRS